MDSHTLVASSLASSATRPSVHLSVLARARGFRFASRAEKYEKFSPSSRANCSPGRSNSSPPLTSAAVAAFRRASRLEHRYEPPSSFAGRRRQPLKAEARGRKSEKMAGKNGEPAAAVLTGRSRAYSNTNAIRFSLPLSHYKTSRLVAESWSEAVKRRSQWGLL